MRSRASWSSSGRVAAAVHRGCIIGRSLWRARPDTKWIPDLTDKVVSGAVSGDEALRVAAQEARTHNQALWEANEAANAALRLVESDPTGPAAQRGLVMAEIAQVVGREGSVSSLPWVARAMARSLAPAQGDRVLRAAAVYMPPYLRGRIAYARGQFGEAAGHFREAARSTREMEGEDVWFAQCNFWLGLASLKAGDDATAEEAFRLANAFYEPHVGKLPTAPIMAGRARQGLARIQWRRGGRHGALEELGRAMGLMRRAGDDEALGDAHRWRVMALLAEGDQAGAVEAATAGIAELVGMDLRPGGRAALEWLQQALARLRAEGAGTLLLEEYPEILG